MSLWGTWSGLGFGVGFGLGLEFGLGFGFGLGLGVGSGSGLDVATRHSEHIGDGVDHLPEAAGDQVHALLPALQRLDQLPDPRREHLQRSSRRRSATRAAMAACRAGRAEAGGAAALQNEAVTAWDMGL